MINLTVMLYWRTMTLIKYAINNTNDLTCAAGFLLKNVYVFNYHSCLDPLVKNQWGHELEISNLSADSFM
jgi:hypothetical protein